MSRRRERTDYHRKEEYFQKYGPQELVRVNPKHIREGKVVSRGLDKFQQKFFIIKMDLPKEHIDNDPLKSFHADGTFYANLDLHAIPDDNNSERKICWKRKSAADLPQIGESVIFQIDTRVKITPKGERRGKVAAWTLIKD